MSIEKDAVKDARTIRDMAFEAAKNELIDQMTPAIRKLVESRLSRRTNEDADRIRRHEDGYGDDFEEAKEHGMSKDKDLEESGLGAMFPSITETDDVEDMAEAKDEEDCDEAAIPTLGEAEDELPVDEEISIDEQALRAVYESAMQAEATVTKGFADMAPPHEVGDASDTGLTDEKSGEHAWEDQEPPAKQKWTVSEIKRLVKAGMAENAKLRAANRKLAESNKKLHEMAKGAIGKLQEMNLFNSKVLHVNKLIATRQLTKEQKKTVVESIDRAKTVNEVTSIYLTLEGSFKSQGVVSETRQNRARTSSGPTARGADPKVVSESVDREAGAQYSRWGALAGIEKVLK
jgi:hypothetical protein